MPRGIPNKQTATTADGTEITKKEAVRRALAELGVDAMPLEIKGYLKKNFNIDMDSQNISNYKSSLKAETKSAPSRPTEAKPTVATAAGGFSLEEIQAVKEVADRIGADKVRQLAEVLSK
jgi:hypothetical protein